MRSWLSSGWLLLAALLLVPPAAALEAREAGFAGASYRVVAVDLARERLELVWKDGADRPYADAVALRGRAAAGGRELLFATNAGMYDRAFRPLGLHVEEGRALRPLNATPGAPAAGNFGIGPNGVFYVDEAGNAGVATVAEWQRAGIRPRLATQSGPMLLVAGAINPAFIPGSPSLKWRSGVCAPKPREVRFAVSEVPVNFHDFARFFRDVLGCRDALYLDGTLSRIYLRDGGFAGAPGFLARPWVGILAVFAEAPAAE